VEQPLLQVKTHIVIIHTKKNQPNIGLVSKVPIIFCLRTKYVPIISYLICLCVPGRCVFPVRTDETV